MDEHTTTEDRQVEEVLRIFKELELKSIFQKLPPGTVPCILSSFDGPNNNSACRDSSYNLASSSPS
jgi:hypothetical protein